MVGSGISLCRAGPSVSGFTLAHAAFVMEPTRTFVIVRRSNGDGAYTNFRMKRLGAHGKRLLGRGVSDVRGVSLAVRAC